MNQKNWGLKTLTPPAVEPITKTELKLHLRIDPSHVVEDTSLDIYIEAARTLSESITGRAFINQTLEYSIDSFPCGKILELPKPPQTSITSIKYIDDNGTEQTLSASNYSLDTSRKSARVILAYGSDWPSTRNEPNAVKVVYVAGYGADGSYVPKQIKNAILLKAGMLYYSREGMEMNQESEKAWQNMLIPFRIIGV